MATINLELLSSHTRTAIAGALKADVDLAVDQLARATSPDLLGDYDLQAIAAACSDFQSAYFFWRAAEPAA